MEIGAILEGNIVDLTPQIQMDFTEEVAQVPLIPEERPTLFGPDQLPLHAGCDLEQASSAKQSCADDGF
jgi:hypothetical protein